MKHLLSLLKYIGIVILIIAAMVGLKLILPQGNVELTYHQAIIAIAVGIVIIAIALKVTFEN